MDNRLIEDSVGSNQPFEIETAAGRKFKIPHRDFISFSPRKTALLAAYVDDEDGEEHFATVPLSAITSAHAKTAHAE